MSKNIIIIFSAFCIFLSAFSIQFQNCVLDTTIPGYDIADNAKSFPDPFAWYTNPSFPGVTLPGPTQKSKCGWKLNENFIWTPEKNTCFLNGQGYPFSDTPSCNNDIYVKSKADFIRTYQSFMNFLHTKTQQIPNQDGSVAFVGNFNYQGLQFNAALSIGHGVLSGKCGSCHIIKLNNKFVLQLQTDVRAWSLELTGGANVWLSSDNYGGTCHIPEVLEVACEEILGTMQ